ncbi:BcABA1, cytochrome P450 monooxygenase [Thozetella sp. PMI_491]|nr:BcABA1, cytochrome P450 monooxygenase [Thozetella sp. PMI_491]
MLSVSTNSYIPPKESSNIVETRRMMIYLVSQLHSWYRLRHVPGPWLAHFSYLWLARTTWSGKQWYVLREFGERYGPLVRIGPNYLTTDDAELLRRISGARRSYNRDPWYRGSRWNPFYDTMFTLTDTAAHDTLKAKTAAGYNGRDTPSLESDVDSQVAAFISLLRSKYLSKGASARPLDFALVTSFFTMDVITHVAFGQPFGYLKQDTDLYDFLGGVRANWPIISLTNDVPWIRSVMYSSLFLRLLGPKYTDQKGMGRVMSASRDVVARRFASDVKDQKDMMQSWMRHGMSQTECESEGLFMIIAGSDTVASVIRITMLNILVNPTVYQKLKQTIATAAQEETASTPITFEQARRIPYLQALIYEGIRIRAPASGPFMKSVPPEGETIHGMFIPGGTAIGMNTASLLRSKKHFGEDAHLFRPERFTDAPDDVRVEMERVVELAFGYGRWMCAGKPVAFMELNKVFFELFRVFDFQLTDPTRPWDSQSYMIFIEENMWVKVTEDTGLKSFV